MDLKIITGLLLWSCFVASLSISQAASNELDTRQRFRRQDEAIDTDATTAETDNATNDGQETEAASADGTTAADGGETTAAAEGGDSTAAPAEGGDSTAAAAEGADSTAAPAEGGDSTAAAAEGADSTAAAAEGADSTAAPAEGGDSTAAAAEGGDSTAAAEGGDSTAAAADGGDSTAAPAEGGDSTAAADGDSTAAPAEGGDSTAAASEGGDSTAAAEGGDSTAAPEGGDSTAADDGASTADNDSGTSAGTTDASATDDGATATGTTESSQDGTDKPGNGHATDADESTAASDDSTGATSTAAADVTTDASGNETSVDDGSSKDQLTTAIVSITDDDNATSAAGDEATTAAAPVQPAPSDRVELRVVINPEIIEVQRGQTYELTCTVYGADASTTIYLIQEEPERRYAPIDAADANDKQVTLSQVSLKARITIDDNSKIGKYTCMAHDAAGNSGSAILTLQEGRQPSRPVYPSVPSYAGGRGYLRIVAPDMAEGDYVEIQCEGAAPEDEGRIQWYFNNRLLSDEQPLYPRGKTLHIRPISRAYLGNYRCSIPGSDYSDANSVLTFGGPGPAPFVPSYDGQFAVAVEIVQGQSAPGQVQEGTQLVLRCRPNGQAVRYRWTFGSNRDSVDRGYTETLVIPQASARDSGAYTCEATNSRGQSARGSVNLYVAPRSGQPVSGRCSIDEATCRNGRCIPRASLYDGKNDCGDNSDEAFGPGAGDLCQPNEIRCSNSDRGRKCVQKFWMCDGDRDCDDGSDEEARYCELLPRQRFCKPSEFHCGGPNATTPNPVCIPRSFQCDGYNDCPDRSDEVGCSKPVVISSPQRQIRINLSQTLTIQCVARGSPAPYINWRLNWGHVCGDGSDNGRCTMVQTVDASDPSLVTGTLTVRNVNAADGGAYSCEALNNQGFIFAIPDAIVEVIIVDNPVTNPPLPICQCNGHSSYCSPDGRCFNCQHNTAGNNCEYCAPGFQGDARQGTPYDCQPIHVTPYPSKCDPQGTHMERGGRCICKYNVEGDRCDQCKRSHFYLNPTTPNGCLPCFCSGVSTDCTATDWRRQPVVLPLNNWNAVPKNFATDRYEAGDKIQQRNGGQEIAIDQSSIGRPANEILYWKAPKEILGDVVTLYDGNIDVHFTNDEGDASNNDEFIWLRGNNIDLVHKIPAGQRFQANSNSTYSVQCNERTFTRKDGTYIDRENILMALSDLDTLLVKVNPIGGRRNAVLRGVTLNPAAREGYGNAAPTVESCRCPANYTGSSCERCAEGYGRPHPLVGIYLGQCWSCRSLCNDRSDQCDRETGKCQDCQGNTEGDRCERCRPGFALDQYSNQCVQEAGFNPYPPQYPQTGRGSYYVDQRPYDPRGSSPLTIVLDGSQPEQRVPLQVLNAQPQSIVWGRTDGSALPANVIQEGSDLVFRNPTAQQAGNYIATVTNPDGSIERIAIYLDYRPGHVQPPVQVTFSPASPLSITEGSNQLIQAQGGYYRVQWRREGDQPFPSGVYQNGNGLQITSARSDQSGTYYCDLYGADNTPVISIPYEVRIRARERPTYPGAGAPRISIEPKVINLKEGQRMIVQYTVSSQDPINVVWNRWTPDGYQPLPPLFTVETNRLVLHRATPDAAGLYQVVVHNQNGEDRQELRINVEPRRGRGRGQQSAPQVRFGQDQYEVGYGEVVDITPNLSGATGATFTWSKVGAQNLPEGVIANSDGTLRIQGRSGDIAGQYNLEVSNTYGRVSTPIVIHWKDNYGQHGAHGSQAGQSGHGGHDAGHDGSRSYIHVRFASDDEQNHQVGRDINLQCQVHGSIERPYEYTFTKDGQPLADNVEVHPNGVLIVRNAQASDAGTYRCEVNFPRAPEAGTQESTFELRFSAGSHGGASSHSAHYGTEYQSHGEYVEVTIEPNEATIGRGETATLACRVKGTQQGTITWGKYAHDTSLPDYARQDGNNVIIAPTDDSAAEHMYLQCSVNVPGHTQPYVGYVPVRIRGNDESRKKKKRRS